MNFNDIPILALDMLDREKAIGLVRKYGGFCYATKGHALFDLFGLKAMVEDLRHGGSRREFYDRKIDENPSAAADLATAAQMCGVGIITVHARGGELMMAEVKANFKGEIYAVTCLSTDKDASFGLVYDRAASAIMVGITNVVCPGRYVKKLKQSFPELCILVPDVRLPGAHAGSHVKPVTPCQAILDGASKIIIGSPVTKAVKPGPVLEEYMKDLEKGLAQLF